MEVQWTIKWMDLEPYETALKMVRRWTPAKSDKENGEQGPSSGVSYSGTRDNEGDENPQIGRQRGLGGVVGLTLPIARADRGSRPV